MRQLRLVKGDADAAGKSGAWQSPEAGWLLSLQWATLDKESL